MQSKDTPKIYYYYQRVRKRIQFQKRNFRIK